MTTVNKTTVAKICDKKTHTLGNKSATTSCESIGVQLVSPKIIGKNMKHEAPIK